MRELKIGNKSYAIHYGQNAICAMENALDEGIFEITKRLNGGARLTDFRALVWAGLLRDNRDLMPEDVGDLCDEAGVTVISLAPECMKELEDSFKRMTPTEPAEENTGKNA